MQHKKGFSLLSFLLYLTIFSMVSLFSCHIIAVLIVPSCAAIRRNQAIIALHIATDFFVRDVRSMRKGAYTWQLISPNELILQHNDRDIGWFFSQNCLKRTEGKYNGGWKEAKTSIVAKGVLQALFTVEPAKGAAIGVELALTPACAPKKPVICYVAFKK